MGSPFGFVQPFGTPNPLPFPLTLLDTQTLTANAPTFPRDFYFPGVPNIIFALSVPKYLGVDVAGMQFNGDSVSGTYWDNADTTPSVALSSDTAPVLAKRAAVSANIIRLGKATNKWRIIWGQIINQAAIEKGLAAMCSIGSLTPPGTTNEQHLAVSGGWDGAAPSQIISRVKILTAGGLSMGIGTQAWFFNMF
jgi:hypothetical protein